MQFRMRILFYLLKSKVRKGGNCPLGVRITINGQRAEFLTGLKLPPADFVGKRVKASNPNAAEYNAIISAITAKLNNIYLAQLVNNKQPSPELIKNLCLHKKAETIEELVDITLQQRLVNIKASTQKGVKTRYNNLSAWLLKNKLNKLFPSEWKHSYTINYVNHLRSTGCEERAKKHYTDLKHVFQTAVNQQILDRSPIAYIKFTPAENDEPLHLTEYQIEQLQRINFTKGGLFFAKDLFIFQCFTGLAYQDTMDFTADMIHSYQGNKYINYRRQKSERKALVPLLPPALEILEKYGYRLPYLHNSKYNLYLKVIGEAIGFEHPLTTHIGRKTCGMLLLNRGVPLQVVSAVLGHASSRTTERFYAKLKKEYIIPEVLRIA